MVRTRSCMQLGWVQRARNATSGSHKRSVECSSAWRSRLAYRLVYLTALLTDQPLRALRVYL